jgi:heme oxygenase (biliverdin-IX-beta and delta-forming)
MPTAALPSSQRTSTPDTLRYRLRSATSEAHARLDAALGAFDLTRRDGYRAFLEANAAALLPLEDALAAAGVADFFPDWQQRTRSGAVLGDLARVGGTARPFDTPAPLDTAGLLGTMYVLEGSRLGAKYLIKSVKQSTDPVVAQATAYLGHGAGDRFWQSFLSLLECHGETLADDAAVVDGARRAFDLFALAAARARATARA